MGRDLRGTYEANQLLDSHKNVLVSNTHLTEKEAPLPHQFIIDVESHFTEIM